MIAVLLNPDLLVTYAAAVVVALLTGVVMTVPPGVVPRFVRGRRYHRDGLARHAVRPAAPSVLETVPDTVSPFAARTPA